MSTHSAGLKLQSNDRTVIGHGHTVNDPGHSHSIPEDQMQVCYKDEHGAPRCVPGYVVEDIVKKYMNQIDFDFLERMIGDFDTAVLEVSNETLFKAVRRISGDEL